MHRTHNLFILMRTRDCEHPGMGSPDGVGFDSVAPGDNHAAILAHGFTDGREAFSLGRIEKSAGIDDHNVSVVIAGCDLVAL